MSAKLKILFSGIFLFLQIYLYAQEKAENIIRRNIPDSLTKDADAVCRLDETEVEIKTPGKITVRERHVFTILNEGGAHLANFVTSYDKLNTIDYVNASLYNAQAKEIRHFKKKDMSDMANESAAFVSDERIKQSGFTFNNFPFTVDYEEGDIVAGAYYIPRWQPPRSEKMSLEVSRYILTVPADYTVRLKLINADIKPQIVKNKDKTTYTWEIRNLPVIPQETDAISQVSYDPFLLIGPTDIELEGYTGNLSTWQDYGKFYHTLFQGRDILPDDLKQQVHKLTDNLSDPYKKIDVLYDYLQKNTHYVLIMFGIGGLQPYDATYVAKNRYGDCKALSNFMVALLKEAGITGYPVVIWGGEEPRDFVVDFPSHQFNHMICAVPVGKDTVWLECTSQSLPPGYLSGFTANRYGLLVNETGGVLVHTPAYLLKDNYSIRKISASMDAEGNLQIKSETKYSGLSYDPIESRIHNYSREEQLDYLKKNLNLPTYTIDACQYSENNASRIPVIQESLNISVSSYAHVTGKRIFIDPNILRRSNIKLPEQKERRLDFQFKNDHRETDSVEITVPGGYSVESQPADLLIETKYGKYQSHLVVKGTKILYYRYLDRYKGRFPASEFEAVRSFYNRIYDADHEQLVLVKTN